jgi:carbon-monoxide dehydrogenase medium subunit
VRHQTAARARGAGRKKPSDREADVIPGRFEYHRPATVADAAAVLARHGDEARPLAGGHSLIPMMKLRMAQPQHLVDLQDIAELKGITEEGAALVIGAMTTQHELLASGLVARHCPILAEAAAVIADPQVRYCGTLGGNVANGDPANDMPAVMLALDAVYRVHGAGGARDIPARVFYEGTFVTRLAAGEILTAVRIPRPPAGHGHAYLKQKRKVGDYATAAAAVILSMDGGTCGSAAIALTNVGDTPLLAEAAAQALVGSPVDPAAVDKAVAAAEALTSPASDGRGPPAFRTKVAGVMVRRAIALARSRAV